MRPESTDKKPRWTAEGHIPDSNSDTLPLESDNGLTALLHTSGAPDDTRRPTNLFVSVLVDGPLTLRTRLSDPRCDDHPATLNDAAPVDETTGAFAPCEDATAPATATLSTAKHAIPKAPNLQAPSFTVRVTSFQNSLG